MDNQELSDSVAEGSESEVDPEGPRMRVGEEYQAEIPDVLTAAERAREDEANVDRDVLMNVQHWDPSATAVVDDQRLSEYIKLARRVHSYTVEQAMGVLYYNKYDLEAAMQDLVNFTPFPDEWSADEEVIFQQAFKSHGKSFRRIRSMLTHKSIPELVQYYYKWKRLKSQSSIITRRANDISDRPEVDGASEVDEEPAMPPSESDSDPDRSTLDGSHRMAKTRHAGLATDDYPAKKRVRLPKGMHIDVASLTRMGVAEMSQRTSNKPSGDDEEQGDEEDEDRQQYSADFTRRREAIQSNKQSLKELESRQQSVEHLRMEFPVSRTSARWTERESETLVQCVQHYGKDFDAMAHVIGSKSTNQCRNYFLNNYSRLNLEHAYLQYLASQGIVSEAGHSVELHDTDVAQYDEESFQGPLQIAVDVADAVSLEAAVPDLLESQ